MHFRDVVGTADDFRETWQDNGQTDMAEAMRAYREVGFDGPVRPDHVPQMLGEDDGEPGYTMLGRLFAYGYIRGHDARHGRTPLLAARPCAPHDVGRTAITSTSNFRAGDRQLVMVVRAGYGREKYSR